MSATSYASARSLCDSLEEGGMRLSEPPDVDQRATDASRLLAPAMLDAPGPSIMAIVDDDPSVGRALQRVVEAGGYTAKTFVSAHEFLDALPRYREACLVLDIYLGAMSGFDLLERLEADGMRIPVILITAHDDASTRGRIESSRVAGHLLKPFDGPALLEAIGRAIGRG